LIQQARIALGQLDELRTQVAEMRKLLRHFSDVRNDSEAGQLVWWFV
jgi:hypothetical protein